MRFWGNADQAPSAGSGRTGSWGGYFGGLRANGGWFPFVVSLSNHERNGGIQHWSWVLRRAQDERGLGAGTSAGSGRAGGLDGPSTGSGRAGVLGRVLRRAQDERGAWMVLRRAQDERGSWMVLRQAQDERIVDDAVRGEPVEPRTASNGSALPLGIGAGSGAGQRQRAPAPHDPRCASDRRGCRGRCWAESLSCGMENAARFLWGKHLTQISLVF